MPDDEPKRGLLSAMLDIVGLPMAWFDAWERKRALAKKLHPMVGWYDPVQLVKTGVDVVVSSALGARVDFRLLEALGEAQTQYAVPADEDGGAWIDFVADVGDGWNPTYAIAQLLAKDSLVVNGEELRRGRVLILGGDAVYPTASKKAYEERFVEPYRTAFPENAFSKDDERPRMYAIPGNHDWYDGLVSFSRLFCQKKRIGAWLTEQKGSYFALALPHDVWLFAIDIQLEADIDHAQLEFFRGLVNGAMKPDSRVIVCTAEPDWVHAARYDPKIADNITALDDVIATKGRVAARIAGDLHHYRRHVDTSGVHYVTSGGGGAFVHPTFPPLNTIHYGKKKLQRVRESTYPSALKCWLLAWLNVFFFFLNPKLGIVTAIVYAVLASAMPAPAETSSLGVAILDAMNATLDRPSAFALVVFVVVAFIGFTDTHRLGYKVIGGAIHASVHLLGALVIAWGVHRLLGQNVQLRAVLLAELAGGFVVGPTILGLYLAFSLGIMRRHANEAFSSLRLDRYKNFLRLRIAPDGKVDVYALKMHRAPKSKLLSNGVVQQNEAPRAELIEKFSL